MCDTSVTENVTGRTFPENKGGAVTEKDTFSHGWMIMNFSMNLHIKIAVTEDTLLLDIPCIYFWR